MLEPLLNRMKPWAAMTQLSLLEFLPDMMAGRQPLDTMLWDRGEKAGKEVGALETIDEQLAVFDQFSVRRAEAACSSSRSTRWTKAAASRRR